MDSCGDEKGRQRREHQPLPVLRKLVVAAMEAKVQRYGPVAAWLRMKDVPKHAALASAHKTRYLVLAAHRDSMAVPTCVHQPHFRQKPLGLFVILLQVYQSNLRD